MLLPGHGTSPKDFAQCIPEDLITAVREEARAMREKHKTFVMAGHSMGGALSTIVAAEVKPDGLILAAPYFGVTYRWYYGLRPETWTRLASRLVPYVYKGKLFLQVNRKAAKADIFSYTWIPSKGLRTLVGVGERAKDKAVLSKIACPVLWLHSEGDVAASEAAAEAAVAQMASPTKETVRLVRSNHHIFWDYEREEVAEAILRFMEGFS